MNPTITAAMTGIIPARAGFTPRPSGRRSARPDHPRSRGVYVPAGYVEDRRGGSSPLARGLHRPHQRTGGRARIIPARAGFTRPDGRRVVAGGDHPRSRGVYPGPGSPSPPTTGSSPLARGLPIAALAECEAPRIIPARAGFTPTNCPPHAGRPDHPRSRGVYPSTSPRPSSSLGSSPLARGLRVDDAQRPARQGIIPARAGFTAGLVSVSPRASDHPRSRGVYTGSSTPTGWRSGSSPLARGLLSGQFRVPDKPRIIPARAGFT